MGAINNKKPNMGRALFTWGWARNKGILGDSFSLKTLLKSICQAIKMDSLGEIVVDIPLALDVLNRDPFEDEGGSSAILLLSTSHAAIHGWPDRSQDLGFFEFSLVSCRDFNPKTVVNILQDALRVTDIKKFTRVIDEP
jgi:S-adenosylmethionine/arginine decarboxylase-like enzyme